MTKDERPAMTDDERRIVADEYAAEYARTTGKQARVEYASGWFSVYTSFPWPTKRRGKELVEMTARLKTRGDHRK